MDKVFGKLRNLDAYPKINEDFYSRTLSGGVITLVSSTVILLLFFSELRSYLHTVTETKLVVDTSRGETLHVNFDVTFPAIPCSLLSLDAMDISGEQHLDIRHDIFKKRIDSHGNVIEHNPPLSLSLSLKMVVRRVLFILLCALVILNPQESDGALHGKVRKLINLANKNGPYMGLVIPNSYEMNPLLQSPNFTSRNLTIDFAGRRFRFGTIHEKEVMLVMTGLGMINAAITTQLLLSLFKIEGVVHYGIAGNANPSLNIGDVTIPKYWSHTGLWNWQRYGDGPEDELALEAAGDYTRRIGYMKFGNYTVNASKCPSSDNLLNNVWYQAEEVFPVDGTPEERQHAFWVPVDIHYYEVSKKLESLKLEGCVNSTTCLSTTPKVVTVPKGISASIYLDNAAYRSFVYGKFNVSPVDMESAAVALICLQQRVPFIAIRALSDLAGGGSAQSNEASTFSSLAADNSVAVVVEFIKNL